MLQYRKVKCPYCDHEFMFHKEFDGRWSRYRIKETKERLWNATCPKCGECLLVKEHELLAWELKDKRVEIIPERPI